MMDKETEKQLQKEWDDRVRKDKAMLRTFKTPRFVDISGEEWDHVSSLWRRFHLNAGEVVDGKQKFSLSEKAIEILNQDEVSD
jgi:ribosomal protein L21E